MLNLNKIVNKGGTTLRHSKIAEIGYFVLGIIFLICIVVQTFLAGLSVFVNPAHWANHSTFVHFFGLYVPLLMLILAFIGRLPNWAKWQSALLVVLIFTMYFTANITAVFPMAAAAHPVIAVLLFWISMQNLNRTRKIGQSAKNN